MKRYFSPVCSFIFTCLTLTGFAQNPGTPQEGRNGTGFMQKDLVVANSGFAEARPLISYDGNALYFSRRYHPDNVKGDKDFQDVWVSYLDSLTGQWTEPQNLGPVINNKKRNAIASLSPDGMDGIFFNTYKNTKRMPLVKSRKSGDSWTKPRVINIDNYVNVSDYTDYYIDFKNKVLILAIQADDTEGDQDLYVSFTNPYGGWTEPLNMGPVLNTEKADFAPFIGSDDRFLFFCSYGHNGLGGSDIFMSVRLDDSWLKWSPPVNLGAGINSPHEETYFSITGDYKYLYYTSYPTQAKDRNISRIALPDNFLALDGPVLASLDSNSYHDIMRSPIANLSGPAKGMNLGTKDKFGKEKEEESELIALMESGLQKEIAGEIEKALQEEMSYPVAIHSLKTSTGLSAAAEEIKDYLQKSFPDLSLEVRQKRDTVEFKIIENLLYEFNSVYVKTEYIQRLSTMARILREKPQLKVQLIGHTDNLGSVEVNNKIARQRVENLVYYFKDRRIAPERIEIVGSGSNSPVGSNDHVEGRLQNRRVETIIRFIEK